MQRPVRAIKAVQPSNENPVHDHALERRYFYEEKKGGKRL